MSKNKDTRTEELWAGVRQYCRAQALFEQGDRVIAAVSGGADSMALLLFLLNCRREWDLQVEAVHINHGLRGEAAGQDEAFVAGFCRENGVPLHLYRLAEEETVPSHAGEDWARQARYARFEALARGRKAKIATAHTLNDQAETLLFRLARGTGVKGAAGIPPKRGEYVRPFLCLQREDTEYLCRSAGVEYRIDETNRTDDYARNRLRHSALPALTGVNSGAVEAMGRFCEQMRLLDGYLAARGEKLLKKAVLPPLPEKEDRAAGVYAAALLAGAPQPERMAALRILLQPLFEPEARHLALMEETLQKGGAVQLGPCLRFVVRDGKACLEQKEDGEGEQPPEPCPFEPGEYRLPGGFWLKAEVLERENFEKSFPVHKKDLNNWADYDKILQVGPILRTRQEGDSFCPAGRGVTKSLKKWFNEWKTPLPERALIPLVAGGSRVLWLWGKGFAQGFAPDKNTQRMLKIHLKENTEES